MKTTASCILLSAGKGERMGGELPKQFIVFDGDPLIIHTMRVLDDCSRIDDLVVVMNPHYMDYARDLFSRYSFQKPVILTEGGETRQMSTYNGLMALKEKAPKIVVIHEAVRPFIGETMVNETIDEAVIHGAVDTAVKTTDTMLQVQDGMIIGMPDRDLLYNGLMPQTFQYDLIVQAHEKAMEDHFTQTTDDVRLVYRLGLPVKVVMDSYDNKKLTTQEDIELFEKIYNARNRKKEEKS
ncbi:2-C-methyl-D-erythritol 4-phosphate cytidylyltransferase [Alkalibacter rhizosphaerae]|uniref:2-C-methyl-D-erythritol 4-phosphate cytidylyltransferase n=1 Tax=Alkalibacter rhizosphaerae TaxID=2815577 RepID=A0A974XGE2_9FIRM|nr:IspD/TarI family cytidylyltransferase [Alkalibacter rhizosphaerae]QSX09296.1 2-C-methyl-D-erythritol 4-phosphate cytidylyltransferase [Alkalibacter rhizosphaerae]